MELEALEILGFFGPMSGLPDTIVWRLCTRFYILRKFGLQTNMATWRKNCSSDKEQRDMSWPWIKHGALRWMCIIYFGLTPSQLSYQNFCHKHALMYNIIHKYIPNTTKPSTIINSYANTTSYFTTHTNYITHWYVLNFDILIVSKFMQWHTCLL